MSDRATAFDRMMNPWAYDDNGELTARARAQETARTQLNSARSSAGTGFSADTGALTTAAGNAEQIHGRLTTDGHSADEATGKVATALADWATGKAAKTAATNWDQCVDALAKTIGETSQALRATAANYQRQDAALRRHMTF
ncbi:hypothetical protein ACIBCA_30640 [Kitasatospora sp. NPDC051170]|uniref:hypothetical protein n=1 Tax=Kitasatospora sp. NPDC051170 TaxID=3364056 RepID=UPI0037958FAC